MKRYYSIRYQHVVIVLPPVDLTPEFLSLQGTDRSARPKGHEIPRRIVRGDGTEGIDTSTGNYRAYRHGSHDF